MDERGNRRLADIGWLVPIAGTFSSPLRKCGNFAAVQHVGCLDQQRERRMDYRRPSPPSLNFSKIDETARNGEFWVVRDAQQFAVARWMGEWQFANGRPLHFEPDEYQTDPL